MGHRCLTAEAYVCVLTDRTAGAPRSPQAHETQHTQMARSPLTPLMGAGLLSQLVHRPTLPRAAQTEVKWACGERGPAVPVPGSGQPWALWQNCSPPDKSPHSHPSSEGCWRDTGATFFLTFLGLNLYLNIYFKKQEESPCGAPVLSCGSGWKH